MYHVANLSQSSIKALMELQNQGANHSREFSLALAYVASRKIALPATEIEDVVGYYRMNHALVIREQMSRINELMPFDMRMAEDDIKSFFQFRLNCVNPPAIPLAVNPESSLTDFFTLSACFSKEALEAISGNGSKVTVLILRLSPIYEDLLKQTGIPGNVQEDPLGEKVPG